MHLEMICGARHVEFSRTCSLNDLIIVYTHVCCKAESGVSPLTPAGVSAYTRHVRT